VALANLAVFRRERTLARLRPKITTLAGLLRPLVKSAHVGEIRQRGFMVGIELVQDRTTKTPYPLERRIGHRVAMEARRRGLIIRPLGNVIVLMPPLTVTRLELARIVAVVRESIQAVTDGSKNSKVKSKK
jgi:adenosylmethionine-8-amino-7-oxononanoate aminotransferase